MVQENNLGPETSKRRTVVKDTRAESKVWILFKWALFLAVLIFLVYYPVRHRDVILRVLRLSLADFAAISALYIVNVIATALSLYCLAGDKASFIPVRRWCGLHWVALFLNFLPMKAGMIARAAYLKKTYGFGYLDLAAILAGHLLLAFGMAGVLGWLSILIVPVAPGYFPLLALGFSAMFCLPFLAWWFPGSLIEVFEKWLPRLGRWVKKAWMAWSVFRENRKPLIRALPFVAGTFIAIAWRMEMVYRSFGVDMSFFGGLLLATAAMVLRKLSIIPGNLGIREGFLTVIAGLLGVDSQIAFIGTLLDRGVMLIWTFVFGGYQTWALFRGNPLLYGKDQ